MTDPVKARLIELLPEIVELKFGCHFITPNSIENILVHKDRETDRYVSLSKSSGNINEFYSLDEAEILGSPITLPDILRAIYSMSPANKTLITLECDGQFVITSFDNAGKKLQLGPTWNLLEHYDNQDQPTKDFIGKLIGVV